MTPLPIERWKTIAKARDAAALDLLLADDVVFVSPVVHTPQRGKAITLKYLAAALDVLGGDPFHYGEEWFGETSAVLEFFTMIDGVEINGADFSGWNAAGQIDRFKVMVRPLKAIQAIHQAMGARLAAGSAPGGAGRTSTGQAVSPS
jgi:hypothetical protein